MLEVWTDAKFTGVNHPITNMIAHRKLRRRILTTSPTIAYPKAKTASEEDHYSLYQTTDSETDRSRPPTSAGSFLEQLDGPLKQTIKIEHFMAV